MLLSAIFIVLFLFTAMGCGHTITQPGHPIDLDVKITISADPGADTAHVHITFLNDDGKSYEFTRGETVVCDGKYLAWTGPFLGFLGGNDYEGTVAEHPAGQFYSFTYKAPENGDKATIEVPVPEPLRYNSPAQIPSPTTPSLTIHYAPGTGSSVAGVAEDSAGNSVQGNVEAGVGSYTFSSSDLPKFVAGPGMISLTQNIPVKPMNPGFKSLTASFFITTTISAVWIDH
jgi:hypothetical protein